MYGYLQNVLEEPMELNRTLKDLLTQKKEVLERIGNALRGAKHIVLTSMGSAQNSLMPMYYSLLRGGAYVSLVEASDVIRDQLFFDDADTVFLIMSRSGESHEIKELVGELREHGRACIGITMTEGSALDRGCSLGLMDVCSFDEKICLKAYSSMALCGLICVSFMRNESIDQEAYSHMFRWMEENKNTILKGMEEISFFKNAHSYVFLSRGYGVGCCKAAGLWMEEIAFVTCDASGIDAFYHGPVRSVFSSALADNMIVPVYLDVLGDARSDRIWMETASAAKASVYIGENCDAPGDYHFLYPHFDVPEEAMSLLLCLYTQLFAYQCCIEKGYTPGISLGIPEDRWVVS